MVVCKRITTGRVRDMLFRVGIPTNRTNRSQTVGGVAKLVEWQSAGYMIEQEFDRAKSILGLSS